MNVTPERPMGAARPHLAARVSDGLNRLTGAVLRRLQWHPTVLAYPGYGQSDPQGWARVLGRVLWAPPSRRADDDTDLRGWRRFLTCPVPDVPVQVWWPGAESALTVRSGRGGYVDAVLPATLPAGRHPITLTVPRSPRPATHPDAPTPPDGGRATTEVTIADRRPQIGLLSDIDDTVLITHLPRPLLALWNTFVLRESARVAVPGMDRLQAAVAAAGGEPALVVYLSTGPWNVVPALSSFLRRHRLRPGPMLMTDWGPTNTGWFRSGREHKATALRRLARELPQVRWLLVGDDGQHDPALYADFADEHPDHVAAVAVRRLSKVEQVLAGHPERAGSRRGTAPPAGSTVAPAAVPWVTAADGNGLLDSLRRGGILPAAPAAALPRQPARENRHFE
ncbi:App1 family protein [Nakamurella flava]|nr:phosphatase domain-containing protein [Nakamurella flava]